MLEDYVEKNGFAPPLVADSGVRNYQKFYMRLIIFVLTIFHKWNILFV